MEHISFLFLVLWSGEIGGERLEKQMKNNSSMVRGLDCNSILRRFSGQGSVVKTFGTDFTGTPPKEQTFTSNPVKSEDSKEQIC